MNYQAIEQKLEQILGSDLAQMENNMLVRDGTDYLVFGRYRISQNHVYKHTSDIGEFSSARVALSWCIADKYQQYNLARDIEYLDQVTRIMDADVRTRVQLAKKLRDPMHRINIGIKIDRKIEQLKMAQERLAKCVNLAKYFQIRGFNNETARTGRPASHRTSR